MIEPLRDSSRVLGPIVTRTEPEPLPLFCVVNEIQPASVPRVHEHPLTVDTATSRVSPLASMVRLSGRSSNRQGAAEHFGGGFLDRLLEMSADPFTDKVVRDGDLQAVVLEVKAS